MSNVTYERLPVRVGGVALSVAAAHRAGELSPIVVLPQMSPIWVVSAEAFGLR